MTSRRFSGRIPLRFDRNELAERRHQLEAAGTALLDLAASNPTSASLPYPEDWFHPPAGAAALLAYEPDPMGIMPARQAVVAYYADHGVRVSPDAILLQASTSEAYAQLFKLVCDPGDEVLAPRPSYPLFEHLASLEGVAVRAYDLRYQGEWRVDLASVTSAIGPRTRAILVVSPNNPTGSHVHPEELEGLARIAGEHELALAVDEVFLDYPLEAAGRPALSVLEAPPCRLFCLSGMSKVAGMPQLKAGWIVIRGPDEEQVVERLAFINDAYLSLSTYAQWQLARLLPRRDEVAGAIRARTRENLATLRSLTRVTPITPLFTEGGWTAVLRVPHISERDVALELLERKHLVTQPGYFYDLPPEGYLVVSLLTPSPAFCEGIERLVSYFAQEAKT